MKQMEMLVRYYGIVLCLALALGCRSPKSSPASTRVQVSKLSLTRDREQARAELLERVPLGTPTEDAIAELSTIGFSCSRTERGFVGKLQCPDKEAKHVDIVWMIDGQADDAGRLKELQVKIDFVGL